MSEHLPAQGPADGPADAPAEQQRAKDLLRKGLLPERNYLGQRTDERLLGRFWWRPCGNSARLWNKLDMDDPFVPPKEKEEAKEHRPVYAAGRFVRLDRVDEKPKTPEQLLIERLKAQAAARPKPAPAPEPSPEAAQPSRPQHGLGRLKGAAEHAARQKLPVEAGTLPPPMPPKAPAPPQQRVSSSGRFRSSAPQRRRTRVVQGGAPPGGVVPRVPGPNETADEPAPPPPRRTVTRGALDRSPNAAAPADPGAPPTAPRRDTPAKLEIPPPPPEAPASAAPAPAADTPARKPAAKPGHRPPGGNAVSMDDLFAAPVEGRVRLTRSKPKAEPSDGS